MFSNWRDDPSGQDSGLTSMSIASYTLLLEDHERLAVDDRPLLTDAGICYVRHAIAVARSSSNGGAHFSLLQLHPFWDAERRQLWLGKELLKEFRQTGSNQVAILSEFQRRGWAARRIDDPLQDEQGTSLKERRHHLRETVKNLNRGLHGGAIHFFVELDGLGVRWDFATAAPAAMKGMDHTQSA